MSTLQWSGQIFDSSDVIYSNMQIQPIKRLMDYSSILSLTISDMSRLVRSMPVMTEQPIKGELPVQVHYRANTVKVLSV